jgi:hypothetical protein
LLFLEKRDIKNPDDTFALPPNDARYNFTKSVQNQLLDDFERTDTKKHQRGIKGFSPPRVRQAVPGPGEIPIAGCCSDGRRG